MREKLFRVVNFRTRDSKSAPVDRRSLRTPVRSDGRGINLSRLRKDNVALLTDWSDSAESTLTISEALTFIETVEAAYGYVTNQWTALGTDDNRAQAQHLRDVFARFDFEATA